MRKSIAKISVVQIGIPYQEVINYVYLEPVTVNVELMRLLFSLYDIDVSIVEVFLIHEMSSTDSKIVFFSLKARLVFSFL